MINKIDKVLGIVMAVFVFLSLCMASMISSVTVAEFPMKTQNVYGLDWQRTYKQLLSAVKPEGNKLYIQSDGLDISFYPAGNLKDFSLHIFVPKKFLGIHYYDCYDTGLQGGKLRLSKVSNISDRCFNKDDKQSVIDGGCVFKGLDQLWIEPMLEKYAIGSPSYYSIRRVGIGNQASDSGETGGSPTFLYVPESCQQGFDMRKFDVNEKLNDDCVYYLFMPVYGQGQDGDQEDHDIIPFLDLNLIKN